MPLLRPTGITWRPPSIGKVAVVSPWRGKLRVQAWPRKRGLPTDPKAKARLDLFALIQRVLKNLQELEISAMREGIRKHNKSHRGQRGSAAIRQRDWHHQRMMGRGFAFDLPDGRTLYPPGVHRTASKLLDHIAADPGEIALRLDSRWDGIQRPAQQSVFTMNPAGNGITWNPI